MSERNTLARPYARAVFEVAQAQGRLPEWSDVLAQAAAAAEDPELRSLLDDPTVDSAELGGVIADACHIAAGPQKNFLDLLAEQRRLPVLGDIAAQFEFLRAEAEKTIDVEVRAATPLDASQEQRLAASLEKRLGRSVRLHVSLDESLLGGAVVKAGDLIIDGSVRSRLEQLAQSIMA